MKSYLEKTAQFTARYHIDSLCSIPPVFTGFSLAQNSVASDVNESFTTGIGISTIILWVLLQKEVYWVILQSWGGKSVQLPVLFLHLQLWSKTETKSIKTRLIGSGKCTNLNLACLYLISYSCDSACTVCARWLHSQPPVNKLYQEKIYRRLLFLKYW